MSLFGNPWVVMPDGDGVIVSDGCIALRGDKSDFGDLIPVWPECELPACSWERPTRADLWKPYSRSLETFHALVERLKPERASRWYTAAIHNRVPACEFTTHSVATFEFMEEDDELCECECPIVTEVKPLVGFGTGNRDTALTAWVNLAYLEMAEKRPTEFVTCGTLVEPVVGWAKGEWLWLLMPLRVDAVVLHDVTEVTDGA